MGYTPQEIDTMVQTANRFSFPYEKLKTEPTNLAVPGPSSKGQPEYLPAYEEMMFQDMLECGPSSMETQPDFLTCGASATADSRCKYFQWIHTPLFIDRRPVQKLKFATKQTQTEWFQQAERNVKQWKREQAWLNQFAESAQKQREQWEAQTKPSNPWKKNHTKYFLLLESRHCLSLLENRGVGGNQQHCQPAMKPASIVPSRNGARY